MEQTRLCDVGALNAVGDKDLCKGSDLKGKGKSKQKGDKGKGGKPKGKAKAKAKSKKRSLEDEAEQVMALRFHRLRGLNPGKATRSSTEPNDAEPPR